LRDEYKINSNNIKPYQEIIGYKNNLLYEVLIDFKEDIKRTHFIFKEDSSGLDRMMYKYYSESFKVYWVQDLSNEFFNLLKKIVTEMNNRSNLSKIYKINKILVSSFEKGTGKVFDISNNSNWVDETESMISIYLQSVYLINNFYKLSIMNLEEFEDHLSTYGNVVEEIIF
jgi:hypothetical protein